jgi:hypothetical protein
MTCTIPLSTVSTRQVNLVLDDAVEYSPDPRDKGKVIKTELKSEILLNGNQIAVLVPGGTGPPEDSLAASF